MHMWLNVNMHEGLFVCLFVCALSTMCLLNECCMK